MVAAFVGGLRSIDVHGDDYRRRVDDIDSLADREIRIHVRHEQPAARPAHPGDARSRPG